MKCILRLILTTRGASVRLQAVPKHCKPTSSVVKMLQANGRFSSSSIQSLARQRGGVGNIDNLPIPVFNDFQAETVTIY